MESGRHQRLKGGPTSTAASAEDDPQDLEPQDSQSALAGQLGCREQGQGRTQTHTGTNQESPQTPCRAEQSGERPARADKNREDRTQGLPLHPTRPRIPQREVPLRREATDGGSRPAKLPPLQGPPKTGVRTPSSTDQPQSHSKYAQASHESHQIYGTDAGLSR